MNKLKKNGNGKQLAVREPKQEPSVALMLQQVIAGGITSENVGTLEKMVGLYERMQEKDAERQFTVAFNQIMKDIPSIHATKAVPNKDGTVRYRYAPLDEIDKQLRPLAIGHGLTYSFAEGLSDNGKVCKICTVQHIAGHKRSNQFTVRTSAPPAANDSQADGSTHSYAKRGALCDAFGIIIEHDDDARTQSEPITERQAIELRQRVRELEVDQTAFLKFAGAADFDQITSDRYDRLCELLDRKEQGKKPASQGSLL